MVLIISKLRTSLEEKKLAQPSYYKNEKLLTPKHDSLLDHVISNCCENKLYGSYIQNVIKAKYASASLIKSRKRC